MTTTTTTTTTTTVLQQLLTYSPVCEGIVKAVQKICHLGILYSILSIL